MSSVLPSFVVALVCCQGAVYHGRANLVARASGCEVLLGAEICGVMKRDCSGLNSFVWGCMACPCFCCLSSGFVAVRLFPCSGRWSLLFLLGRPGNCNGPTTHVHTVCTHQPCHEQPSTTCSSLQPTFPCKVLRADGTGLKAAALPESQSCPGSCM